MYSLTNIYPLSPISQSLVTIILLSRSRSSIFLYATYKMIWYFCDLYPSKAGGKKINFITWFWGPQGFVKRPPSKIHETCWRPTSFLLPSRFPTIYEFKLRHDVLLPQILWPQILNLPRLQFHFKNSEISDFKYWIAGKCHLPSTSSACYLRNCRTAVGVCIFGSTLQSFIFSFSRSERWKACSELLCS